MFFREMYSAIAVQGVMEVCLELGLYFFGIDLRKEKEETIKICITLRA